MAGTRGAEFVCTLPLFGSVQVLPLEQYGSTMSADPSRSTVRASMRSAKVNVNSRSDGVARALGTSLSSPCLLSEEGRREAGRVLGSMRVPYVPDASSRSSTPSSTSRQKPDLKHSYQIPLTTSSMYGARVSQADKGGKWFPKNTCDLVGFVDSMTKTQTPYCFHLRM